MSSELILAMNGRNPGSRLSKDERELARYLARERGFNSVGLRSMCAFCRWGEHESLPKNAMRVVRARSRNDRGSHFPLLFFLILLVALFLSFFFWP